MEEWKKEDIRVKMVSWVLSSVEMMIFGSSPGLNGIV